MVFSVTEQFRRNVFEKLKQADGEFATRRLAASRSWLHQQVCAPYSSSEFGKAGRNNRLVAILGVALVAFDRRSVDSTDEAATCLFVATFRI